MAMTIEKKFVSVIGTRCAMRSTASGRVSPRDTDSTTLRNSDLTGSTLSLATMRIVSPSGRPALTPRTMTSIAFGKFSMKRLIRRARNRASARRGAPPAPMTATRSASSGLFVSSPAMAARTRPSAALKAMNCRREILSPACSIRASSPRRWRFFFSSARRPSAICLRRAVFSALSFISRAPRCAPMIAARRFSDRDCPASPANAAPAIPSARQPAMTMGFGMTTSLLLLNGARELRGVERGGEPLLFAKDARALPEARPADAGRPVLAPESALRVLALDLVDEKVLGDDDVALHSDHLGHMRDAARSVAQAGGLDDHVDRGGDHLTDGLGRQRVAAHGDHRFDAAQRLARRVRVQRAHRAVVAGVHRLQKIERLRPAHFAHDDPLRAHAQAVPDEVAHRHLPRALKIGRPRFEAHHMRLLQLQFGRVLAGDDALVGLDEIGQTVEQRGLAAPGSPRAEDVAAHAADDLENLGAGRRDRAEPHQLVERQLVLPEFADRQRDPVDGERRSDHVDARAVEQARVADRRGFVDAPADLAHDALADVHQLRVVAEAHARELDLAADLDEAASRSVDHDVGDVVARQQGFERTEAEDVVADVVEQILLLGDRQHKVLDRDDFVDDVADFFARGVRIELGEGGEIYRVDELAKNLGLGLIIAVLSPLRLDGGRGFMRRGPLVQ